MVSSRHDRGTLRLVAAGTGAPTASRGAGTSFGAYVRRLREENRIGQRELARALEVSPSYLNDIEKDKRVAPRPDLVKAIADVLGADPERIFDLAGRSRNTIPPPRRRPAHPRAPGRRAPGAGDRCLRPYGTGNR